MASVIVVYAQWGDEGKGKIVDYLSEKCKYIVRSQIQFFLIVFKKKVLDYFFFFLLL